MQNEFEKQVQQKMEELDLVPSAPVWEKIEMQIRRKKDRRRFIFWLPFLIIFLAGGLWFIPGRHQQNLQSVQQAEKKPVARAAGDNSSVNVTKQLPNKQDVSKFNLQSPAEVNKTFQSIEITGAESGVKSTAAIKTLVAQSGGLKKTNEQMNVIVHLPSPTGQTPEVIGKKDKLGKDLSERKDSIQIKSSTNKDSSMVVGTNDPGIQNKKNEEEKKDLSTPDSTILKTSDAPIKQKKTKWILGLAVSAGTSGVGEGLKFGSKNLNSAALGTPAGSSSYSASPVTNGASLSLGLVLKKQLSKRVSFTTGIQYDYYITTILVGKKNSDSSFFSDVSFTNQLSNGGAYAHPYHNGFHFISIPVLMNFQMLYKHPLNFEAGVSVQQMFSTSGLQYSSALQVYYSDPSAYRKTQLFSSVGFNYEFSIKGNLLVLGPQLQYGIMSLENENTKYHLFSFGLKAQYFFKK